MSAKTERILDDLSEAIKNIGVSKTSPFDARAVVRRIDKETGTAWVHFDGGEDETPVNLTINAAVGDTVQVRVSDGYAFIIGNTSAPPTDDTTANVAIYYSKEAGEIAQAAIEDAERAKEAADSAEASAAAAQESATDAYNSASQANIAANSALTQLSVVEDVAGVLNWVSEHGTYALTTDTEVVPGKMYFVRSGSGTAQDPYEYTIVTNPESNPSQAGYYELDSVDETVSNYISSHLALTNAGLWVVKDNSGYKILLANDGVKIYDSNGTLVSVFGESINFSSTRPQYIGGEDAYIIFYDSNNDGVPDTINIGGTNVKVGGTKNLSDMLTSLDITTRQTSGGAEIDIAGQTVSLSNGVDVVSTTWYYKKQAASASAPTVDPTVSPPVGWSTQEPNYTEGSTDVLYTVVQTTYSDGSYTYSNVSLSSSYAASTTAYNKGAAAMNAVTALDAALDQEEVLARLTNNGEDDGIYLEDGNLYINATYIHSGYLNANYIKGGTIVLGGDASAGNATLEVYDTSNVLSARLNSDGIYAIAGTIAGWTIGSSSFVKETPITSGTASTQYRVYIQAPSSPTTSHNAFAVQQRSYDGASTYGTWSSVFSVTYAGAMHATAGTIAGWTIGDVRLTKSSTVTSGTASTQYGAMLQAPASPGTGDTAFGVRKRSYDGSSYGSWSYNFYVTYGGALHAKNATFDDYIYVDGNASSLIKLENGPNDIQLYYGGLQCSIELTSTATETAHYTVMQRMYTSDNAYQTYIDCKQWIISSKTFTNPASLPTGMTYVHVTNSGITRFSSGTRTASIGDTFTTYGDNAFEARTGFTIGTTPSSNTGKTGYYIQDSAGNNMARWDAYYWADGRYGLRFGTARAITGGTDVGNFLSLSIDSSGNRYVGFSESAVWRNALGFDRFQNIVTESSDSSSSATFSHTLESGGIYLVIVDKINTTSANYAGMYIVGIHSNNSNVKAISSATSATVSVSTTTLTISLSATYMKVAIYRIS